MAKVKEEVNKSEAIRAALKEAPKATAKEIVEALKAKGVETNEGLVYQVKRKMTPAKGKPATSPTKKPAAPSNGKIGIGDAVTEVKALAKKVGGLSELQKIVVALHTD